MEVFCRENTPLITDVVQVAMQVVFVAHGKEFHGIYPRIGRPRREISEQDASLVV
jgi:hypothetical protein